MFFGVGSENPTCTGFRRHKFKFPGIIGFVSRLGLNPGPLARQHQSLCIHTEQPTYPLDHLAIEKNDGSTVRLMIGGLSGHLRREKEGVPRGTGDSSYFLTQYGWLQ